MIRVASMCTALVLVYSLLGLEYWGTSSWWEGGLAGTVIALVWYSSRATASFLSLVGFGMLIATVFGVGQNLGVGSKAFFNGASLGMLVGLALSAWWNWKKLRPILVSVAKVEKATWVLRILGESNGQT